MISDRDEYTDAWREGEESSEDSEPLQAAAEAARKKAADERREFEEAYREDRLKEAKADKESEQ